MTRYQMRRIQLLKGWRIPTSMEWLFWPIGYAMMDPEGRYRRILKAGVTWGPDANFLPRRFSITNRDAFMAVLQKLGAVKQKGTAQ
jgi:hypothetical protein